jgi:hypothetical protein
MVGEFIITKLSDSRHVEAKSVMNDNILVSLWLMPLNRTDTSGIAINDRVFAVVDDVTGTGVLLVNETHDFNHSFSYDLTINGKSFDDHWHGYIDTIEGTPTTKQTAHTNTSAVVPV